MPNLSPWNIFYPDQTTGLTPLASKFSQMAQTVSDALTLVNKGAVAPVTNATARDALFPSGVRVFGSRVLRLDLGYEEMYYTAYNADTNPGGASPAGWYPANGSNIAAGSVRGHTDVWTATTLTSVFGATFTNFPAGTIKVSAFVNWEADSVAHASIVLLHNSTQIQVVQGTDIMVAGMRAATTIVDFVEHTGGNLVLALSILADSTDNKTILENTRILAEYVAPPRGGIMS